MSTLAAAGGVATAMVGVVVGFALARVSDWWSARPNSEIVRVSPRSLYATWGAGMNHWGWIQSRPEEASHVLVVVSAMVHNQSTHDDAIMEGELLAGSADRCRAPAHESMVQEFVPEPIRAHGIESLRLVFELPRDQLGDELYERIKAASCTLQLTTVRGRRCSKDVDLTNSFLDQQFAGKSDAPPIRGYTDVRVQSGTFMDQSFFGSRRRFDEHELW